MTEKSAAIVNQMAKRLSIVNVDGHVTFVYKGEIEKEDKIFDTPKVHIHEEVLDAITADKSSDSKIIKEITNTLDIVE